MKRLRAQAYDRSGVPYSAVETARNADLYERLGWDTICRLSDEFYSRVYGDEEWFRKIFANTTREAATRNQREFLAQEFGGPPLYRERKGHTAILGRHGPYPVDERAAERWLEHMNGAVNTIVPEEGNCRELLMNYFNHMAWFIVYGRELVSGMRTVGYFGKHREVLLAWMDPTLPRPCGVPSISDASSHNQPHTNLTYQPIFAARITNLLEERRQIYKRALLDELYRLRQLVVSTAATGEHTAQSDALPPHPQTQHFGEGSSDTPPAPTAVRETSLLQDAALQPSAEQHDSNSISNSSPADVDDVSNAETRVPNTPNTSKPTSQLDEELSEHPSHMQQPDNPSSSTFDTISVSISSPLQINVKRLPALNHVISIYRKFNEMAQAYSSISPFFVTLPATVISGTAQHQLDPNTSPDRQLNRQLNFHSNPHELSSQSFPVVPNSLNLRFTHQRRRYIPPLFARLFCERELALLFDSQLRYIYSAERVSLAKATDLYIQQLLPTRHASSPSHTPSERSQLKLPQASTAATPINHRDDSAQTSLTSPSSALFFPKEVPYGAKTFQRRTFYHSMTRAAELQAPTAAWHDDMAGADVGAPSTPPVRSHYAYAVSSDVRGIPYYMNLQGVHSGHGNASVTLAFGFQRRTNYPFRRAYDRPRTAETFLVPPKVPPRVSGDFASRVPVSGLSPTLLHLFQPDVHRGLFFGKAQDDSLLELEDMHTKKLYSISAEGKLVQEHAK